MSTGQFIFYSGFALLGLTIIVAVVFLLKKPEYIPENAVCESAEAGRTQRLQNSYPPEREMIHRESSAELMETELLPQETALIFQSEETEILPPTEKI